MAGLLEQNMPQQQAPQQGQMPQGQQGGGRKANQSEQEQFNLVVKQALQFLSSPEQSKMFLDSVQKVGPEKSIAVFVKKTLDSIFTAAQSAGAKVDPNTMTAAAQAVASALVKILVQSGMQIDEAAATDAAMQEMEGL